MDLLPAETPTPDQQQLQACFQSTMRRICTLLGSSLLLASCGDSPASWDEMESILESAVSEAAAPHADRSSAPIDVSSGFSAALKKAVEYNDAYRAAIALEAESLERVGIARSMRRLQITSDANIGGIREASGETAETTTGISGGLNITQLVYDGGESAATVDKATAEALAARAERVMQANELALEAARAWIDAWQFDERLRLLRARTRKMATLLGQMERMAANGLFDRATLDKARGQIVDIRLEEQRLEAQRREAFVRFERFFRTAPAKLPQPTTPLDIDPARTAQDAQLRAPYLTGMAAEILIARSAVAQAEAAFKPKARLRAGVTSPIEEAESTDVTLGISIQYTLGDGGRRESELRAARARLTAAEAGLRDANKTLTAELAAASEQLAAIEASMPLLRDKIRLTASEAEASRSQIATGQSTLRQLVEAEIENYRARDRYIALRAERDLLEMTIASRTGALARALELVSVRFD